VTNQTSYQGKKRCDPWCERNRQPILEVLQRLLPNTGTVLEIASGSGQHATFFADKLRPLTWQPSDIDPDRLASIRAWVTEAGLANLCEPLHLDVLEADWGVGEVEAIFCANMIHITPWECCLALLAGARRHLVAGGLLILYGPFRINGRHTAESNRRFDKSLRDQNPGWGVRNLDAVCRAAGGLTMVERVEMPANNQMIVFQRVSGDCGTTSTGVGCAV
jgi:cyclopropane fatty-acyl-phospholipid synthase-like methyltransferase